MADTQQNKRLQHSSGWLRNLDPRHLGIRHKILFAFILVSFLSTLLLTVISSFYQSRVNEKNSFSQITSVNEIKKREVEDYLTQIRAHVSTLSQSTLTIDAAKDFKESFFSVSKDVHRTFTSTEMQKMEVDLKYYYRSAYLTRLSTNLDMQKSIRSYWFYDINMLILQYLYISSNPNPVGSKHLLVNAADGTAYSKVHSKYHLIFKDFIEKFDFYDLFIVDNETGNVIYTVFKEVDFASNLLSGAYSDSNLGEAFKSARTTTNKRYTKMVDFAMYDPSYGVPAAFISAPIYDGEKKIGVLVLQVRSEKFDEIMTGKQSWKEDGMGESGQTCLIGDDFLMRSNDRKLIENKVDYLSRLSSSGVSRLVIDKINRLNTSILQCYLKNEAAIDAIRGNSGQMITQNSFGDKILSSYSRISNDDLNWALITEINYDEISQDTVNQRTISIFISIFIFIVVIIFSSRYSHYLSKRILKVRSALDLLARGESVETFIILADDEIGKTINSLNNLAERINEASKFAISVGQGKLDAQFVPVSENDQLGISLSQMHQMITKARNEEEQRKKEDEKRKWAMQGIANINEILRNQSHDINILTDSVISTLVHYIDALQGSLFILNDNEKNNLFLELFSTYAFDRKKFINKEVHFGEGIVGTVAVEKKTLLISNIPENYLNISSGLGKAEAKFLLLVPLKFDNNTLGVIELASFTEIDSYKVDFVEKVSESLSTTIASARINEQTKFLLRESQRKASEMSAAEEEMHQNMEELHATQEELARRTTEMENQKMRDEKKMKEREQILKEAIEAKENEIAELKKQFNIL